MLIYRKPPNFYPKEEIKKAIEDPVIIHYTTSFISRRPWVEGVIINIKIDIYIIKIRVRGVMNRLGSIRQVL